MRRPPRRPAPDASVRTARGERGATSLEFAVLSFAFLFIVFMVVQAALYYHARNVIKAEAEGVARAVRAYPAEAGGPAQRAIPDRSDLLRLANAEATRQWGVLDGSGDTTSRPAVQVDLTGFNQVQVTISANPISILPGIGDMTITATAGGPFEVFKQSGQN
jgi:Flp pilus assembly protein TadG